MNESVKKQIRRALKKLKMTQQDAYDVLDNMERWRIATANGSPLDEKEMHHSLMQFQYMMEGLAGVIKSQKDLGLLDGRHYLTRTLSGRLGDFGNQTLSFDEAVRNSLCHIGKVSKGSEWTEEEDYYFYFPEKQYGIYYDDGFDTGVFDALLYIVQKHSLKYVVVYPRNERICLLHDYTEVNEPNKFRAYALELETEEVA